MQESTAAKSTRRRLRTLNPLLAVSLEARIERPTAENARTPYSFVSSVCSRKRSRLGIADPSADQDTGRRAAGKFFVKRSSFYTKDIVCSKISGVSRFRSLLAFSTRCE